MHKNQTATGDPMWVATGHAEIRNLLCDERLGRSHPNPETAARVNDAALFGPMGNFETEVSDHARMRSILQPQFSARTMGKLRPRVSALTSELLDTLTDRPMPVDLIAAVAVPLPVLVLCELLGVPGEDREQFGAWIQQAWDAGDGERAAQGQAALFTYLSQLATERQANPTDDVLSRIATTEGVHAFEAAALSMATLFAGRETMVNAISVGVSTLLETPDRWSRLVAEPTLVPGAVEEFLRAPGQPDAGLVRYARTDMDVDGATVCQGDLVLLDVNTANLDPEVFPEPERFDMTRQSSAHLTFGHGLRYCIGAPLARIELQELFTQLISRFPDMRRAVPVADLRRQDDVVPGALVELPVTW
ncbi:cytochrome P450 [Nocardia tengchongensis]|uniref:cytochrome P450 n=1 Tax=Nocardia tengchongensis TaxID=2055889 RepID=UPI003615E650